MIDIYPILDDSSCLREFPADVLVLTQFSDLPAGKGVETVDQLFDGRISSAREAVDNSFDGRMGQQMVVALWTVDGPQFVFLCGFGPHKLFNARQLYKAMTVATHTAVALDLYRMAIPVAHLESTGLSFVEACSVIAQVQADCTDDFFIDVICTEADSRLLSEGFNICNEQIG